MALTTDGQLTYCTASDENIGRGRCNHVTHQRLGETQQQFVNRISIIDAESISKVKQEQERSNKSQQGVMSWIKNLATPKILKGLDINSQLSDEQRQLESDRMLAAKFESISDDEGELVQHGNDHEFVMIDIESRFVNFFYNHGLHWVHLTHMSESDSPEESMELIKKASDEIIAWDEWGFDEIDRMLTAMHEFILDPELHHEIKGIGIGLEFEYYDFRNPELNKIAAKFEEIKESLPIMVDYVTPDTIKQAYEILLEEGLI